MGAIDATAATSDNIRLVAGCCGYGAGETEIELRHLTVREFRGRDVERDVILLFSQAAV